MNYSRVMCKLDNNVASTYVGVFLIVHTRVRCHNLPRLSCVKILLKYIHVCEIKYYSLVNNLCRIIFQS